MKEATLQQAILGTMKDVEYIQKTGLNAQQGYKFASAEAIVGEVRAAALKHGLLISISYTDVYDLEPGQTKNGMLIYRVRVRAVVTLRCGTESLEFAFFGEGADSGDKALPKAKTMCLKQALRQIFLIETGEADPDRETVPETQTINRAEIESAFKSLPPDVKQGIVAALDKLKVPTEKRAAYIASVLSENHNDPELIRSWIKDHAR